MDFKVHLTQGFFNSSEPLWTTVYGIKEMRIWGFRASILASEDFGFQMFDMLGFPCKIYLNKSFEG